MESSSRTLLYLFPKCPQHFRESPITPLLPVLLLFLTIPSITTAKPQIVYSGYCNDVVRESFPSPTPLADPIKLTISDARFTLPSKLNFPKKLRFTTRNAQKTQNDGVFRLDGDVDLRGFQHEGHFGNLTRRGLRIVYHRPPRIPVDSLGYDYGFHDFHLSGFWNSTSGKLCMVGSGDERRYGSLFGVFKVNFPNVSSIFDSYVNGTLEFLTVDGKLVESLSILGVNSRNYEYKLINKEIEKNVFKRFDNLSNVSRGLRGTNQVCELISRAGFFNLEYADDCESANCDIVHGGKGNFALPSRIIFKEIEAPSGWLFFEVFFRKYYCSSFKDSFR